MLFRTKYLVIGLLLGVVILGAGASTQIRPWHFPSRLTDIAHTQTALLIQSEASPMGVTVATDTTRETNRASLREELRTYVSSGELSDGSDEALGALTEKEDVPVTETVTTDAQPRSTSMRCAEVAPRVSSESWGPLEVVAIEGAHILSSYTRNAEGAPLHTLVVPLEPQVDGNPHCLPNDMIAVLLDGTIVVPDMRVSSNGEGLAGYARDGFLLYGSFEEGREVTSKDLDQCHGHVHTIIDQGVQKSMYHYHITNDAPYTLSCFRGVPV